LPEGIEEGQNKRKTAHAFVTYCIHFTR